MFGNAQGTWSAIISAMKIEWAYELLTSPEWFDFLPKDKLLHDSTIQMTRDPYNRWIVKGVGLSY